MFMIYMEKKSMDELKRFDKYQLIVDKIKKESK